MRPPSVSQGAAPRRAAPAAAATGTAVAVARPRQAQQQQAAQPVASNSAAVMRYSVRTLAPTVLDYVGTIKSIGANVVQALVKQPGSSSLRLQDFPAKSVLGLVQGVVPGTDRLFVLDPGGRTVRRLLLTGYEGDFTVFVNDKGETFRFRSDSIYMESDKGNAETFGLTSANRASGGGAGGGRAGAPRRAPA